MKLEVTKYIKRKKKYAQQAAHCSAPAMDRKSYEFFQVQHLTRYYMNNCLSRCCVLFTYYAFLVTAEKEKKKHH